MVDWGHGQQVLVQTLNTAASVGGSRRPLVAAPPGGQEVVRGCEQGMKPGCHHVLVQKESPRLEKYQPGKPGGGQEK